MKFMCLADIHEDAHNWPKLVEEVNKQRPELVLIAGDLFPKENGILAQQSYLPQIKECAAEIREMGAELVLITGNDDNKLLVPEMEKGDAEGLWHYVVDRVKFIKGYYFCGCPWVPDYPFPYKHWVAPETPGDIAMSSFQLDQPLKIDSHNQIEIIPDLGSYLAAKTSIQELLENLLSMVNDLSKSIWLIHTPPAYLELDVCGSGDRVGSTAVYSFLQENQPMLSIHGHIHEAPKHNRNIWMAQLGRTKCIQAGQLSGSLYYVTFIIEEDQIKDLTHSIY